MRDCGEINEYKLSWDQTTMYDGFLCKFKVGGCRSLFKGWETSHFLSEISSQGTLFLDQPSVLLDELLLRTVVRSLTAFVSSTWQFSIMREFVGLLLLELCMGWRPYPPQTWRFPWLLTQWQTWLLRMYGELRKMVKPRVSSPRVATFENTNWEFYELVKSNFIGSVVLWFIGEITSEFVHSKYYSTLATNTVVLNSFWIPVLGA